ncbi:hypothetical protein KR084_011901, partial [Drosophila pseudotakahashii]
FVNIGTSYYYIETNLKKNWFDAYESCRRMQADLITLETLDELIEVTKYLVKRNLFKRYWTSGNDLAKQGEHVWFSNGDPLPPNLWYAGEPNNKNRTEHCDEMGSEWNPEKLPGISDRKCLLESSYICESLKPPTVVTCVKNE